jgi:hypothetical protein
MLHCRMLFGLPELLSSVIGIELAEVLDEP